MRTQVRRIRENEGVPLREIRLRALQADPDAFASTYEREIERPADRWDDWAARASSGPKECLFVAEMDHGLRGMVAAYTPDDDPEARHLIAMWVAPEARSVGTGTALVRAVIDWARESGAEEIRLWVVDTNHPARSVYERAGFALTDVSQPVPSNPSLTESLMRLPLREVSPQG